MKRAALFVGIDRYQDPEVTDLACAESDAYELYGLFKHRLRIEYTDVLRVPSAVEVIRAVERLCKGLRPGDLFLFFFAGHGVEQQGDQLLLCPGAIRRFLEEHPQDTLALNLVRRASEGHGLHRVLILDSCRSNLESNVRDAAPAGLSIARSVRDIGAIRTFPNTSHDGDLMILFSCGEGQQARELPERKRGLFTAALLEGLEQGVSRHCAMTLDDAFIADLEQRMDRIANDSGLPGGQRPAHYREGTAPVLVAGRSDGQYGEGAGRTTIDPVVSEPRLDASLSPDSGTGEVKTSWIVTVGVALLALAAGGWWIVRDGQPWSIPPSVVTPNGQKEGIRKSAAEQAMARLEDERKKPARVIVSKPKTPEPAKVQETRSKQTATLAVDEVAARAAARKQLEQIRAARMEQDRFQFEGAVRQGTPEALQDYLENCAATGCLHERKARELMARLNIEVSKKTSDNVDSDRADKAGPVTARDWIFGRGERL